MSGYLVAKGNNTEEAKKLAIQYADDHKKSRLTISHLKYNSFKHPSLKDIL